MLRNRVAKVNINIQNNSFKERNTLNYFFEIKIFM